MDAPRVAIRGGNCNNGANCGFRYVNVNNAASNSNWNIGASPVFRTNYANPCIHNSLPLGKNELRQSRLVGLSSFSKGGTYEKPMKRLGYLYDKLIDADYLESCVYKAFRKKKKTSSIRRILRNPRKHAVRISEMIQNGTLPFIRPRQIKVIKDGKQKKERTITKATNYEHILHHAMIGLLEKRFINSSYKYSVASIPKRGDLYGKKHLEHWIRRYKGRKLYVLKFDIKKFFDTIDRQILFDKLERIIKDKKFLEVIEKTIYFDASKSNRGVPIGYYTSQWFANFYLQSFDYYIKQNLRIKDYMRYMDDAVVLLQNKRKLRKAFSSMVSYLKLKLCLRVKRSWQIFMLSYKPTRLMLEDGWVRSAHYGRPIDFMGYKFYPWKTTIRKVTLRSARRAALSFQKNRTLTLARRLITYIGRIAHADTRAYYNRYLKPIISFEALRWFIRKEQSRILT